MRIPHPRRIYESAGFYPLTMLYVVGVCDAVLVVDGALPAIYGLFAFTLAVVIAILAAAYREIKTVHHLVARIERTAVNGDPKRG